MRFQKKEPTTEPVKEDTVDTQLELLKYATQVQSRIRKDITSDFTLCKLGDQDKEGITNMTVNAHVARRKFEEIKNKSKWYEWNNGWTKTKPEKKLEIIDKRGELAFDMYMTKVMMTAILNRNVEKNHLVNFLKQNQEPEMIEPEPSTESKIKHRIIKKENEKTKEDKDR